METLIELYDERAIENVLGPETFRPDRIIYLCPTEIAQNRSRQQKMQEFFAMRGWNPELEFAESSIYKTDKILAQLEKIALRYPDCALDVTGGTDAALVAAGMFSDRTGVATFTYSRKKNRFYDISNASFAENRDCSLIYSVEDFFVMAGGTLRKGRVDNRILGRYIDKFDDFFRIFLDYRKEWNDFITYMTRLTQAGACEDIPLSVKGAYVQKGERGSRVHACPGLLRKLEKIGFLRDLQIEGEETVAFTFEDLQIRTWLRDVGSVLELYMYKVCCQLDIFHDVVSSAIVDWDGTVSHDSVSNEIDVVATRGVVPLFISCKATEIRTEALNELAILADRFGGKGAKAAIVTTERCNAAARHRAAQLGIAVIDLEELEAGRAGQRIRVIMKAERTEGQREAGQGTTE